MTDRRRQLDELLRAKDGDAGCTAGLEILDAYVDRELAGKDPAREFPSTAIHLESCPGCKADHDGLLEVARRWLLNRERFAAAAAGAGDPGLLLALEAHRPHQGDPPARNASWTRSRRLDRTEASASAARGDIKEPHVAHERSER